MLENDTARANSIIETTEASVKGFFAAFDTVREKQGKKQGAPTDEEQDLARAALVFAAAGLDASIKQMIRDCIPRLSHSDQDVKQKFHEYVKGQLREPDDEVDNSGRYKFLTRVLLADSPKKQLIEEYIEHLTGDSLQSVDQLFKVVSALGLDTKELARQKTELREIFKVRNQIVHDLDVKFPGRVGQRNRNSRQKQTLQEYSNKLIDVAENLIKAVEDKMAEKPSTGTKAPE